MLPQDAKKMRHALKQLGDKVDDEIDPEQVIMCDMIETRSPMVGAPKSKVQIVMYKEGKPVAAIWGDRATLKRLSSEMKFWTNFKSGALKGCRFGNRI